jgi:hypothetical protein
MKRLLIKKSLSHRPSRTALNLREVGKTPAIEAGDRPKLLKNGTPAISLSFFYDPMPLLFFSSLSMVFLGDRFSQTFPRLKSFAFLHSGDAF